MASVIHQALSPGFGRPGGELGFLADKIPTLNDELGAMSGLAKLIVMCAGIGSPGTLAAVFGRGKIAAPLAAP